MHQCITVIQRNLGFDTFGLFKLVGGIAKGHPNEKDIAGAVDFVKEILRKEM